MSDFKEKLKMYLPIIVIFSILVTGMFIWKFGLGINTFIYIILSLIGVILILVSITVMNDILEDKDTEW